MVILIVEQQRVWFVFGSAVARFLAGSFAGIRERLVGATELTKGFFLVDTPVLTEGSDGFGELAADTVHIGVYNVTLSLKQFPF